MKRTFKVFSASLMILTLIVTLLIPVTQSEAASKKVKLSATSKTLTVGDTAKLTLNNAQGTVTWSSSNKKVVTVSKGKITAKAAGKAVITAKNKGKSYKCNVTVKAKEKKVEAKLNYTSLELLEGETRILALDKADIKYIFAGNTKIVSVNKSGEVTGLKEGSTVVTITGTNGDKYECNVTVNRCPQTGGQNIVTVVYKDGTKSMTDISKNKLKLMNKEIVKVYFGEYPQTRLSSSELTSDIIYADYDRFGVATVGDYRYLHFNKDNTDPIYNGTINTVSGYYRFEPIEWRVLYNDDGKLMLMSEKVIDSMSIEIRLYPYDKPIKWDISTARSWLNGYDKTRNEHKLDYNVLNSCLFTMAFTKDEQNAIPTVEKNIEWVYSTTIHYEGKISDKVSLMRASELINTKYGFLQNDNTDENRVAFATEYALDAGVAQSEYVPSGSVQWWTATATNEANKFAYVDYHGGIYTSGTYGIDKSIGIRPTLYLDLNLISE